MSVTLDMLHAELKARLEADSYFADITILLYNERGIVDEVNKALGGVTTKAGKLGAFIYLSGWFLDANSKDAPGPIFDAMGINAVAVESRIINDSAQGTGKSAIEIALRIAQVLHHYRPDGLAETIVVDRATIRQVPAPDEGAIAYQVPVLLPPNLQADSRVATPAITPTDGTVPQTLTITCATAAAAIYYTTDDSHPWSGNSKATLYSVPFSVATACAVRAIAYKTGMIASDSALGIYT